MTSTRPLDDIRALLGKLPGPNRTVAQMVAADETGRAGDLLRWLASWSGRQPAVLRPGLALFAATHGFAEAEMPGTAARVREQIEGIAQGYAPVSSACAASDMGLRVFDLALEMPTGNIAIEPALDERACAATIAFGMEAIAGGSDVVVLGACGEGGEVAAAAVLCALLGETLNSERSLLPQGISKLIDSALARLAPEVDPFETMAQVGGREIAALTGAIVAARLERIPVLLDGISAIAAAAVVAAAVPDGVDHCVAADLGAIGMQRSASAALGMDHVLDIGLEAGSGSGGAVAIATIKALISTRVAPARAGPTH